MDFITSDFHFSHKSILKWPSRPFSSIEEMDQYLLKSLNDLKFINGFNTLYHLGDFFLGRRENLKSLLNQIEIPIVFIWGNHDKQHIKETILSYPHFSGYDYLEIKHNNTKICLFHFPIYMNGIRKDLGQFTYMDICMEFHIILLEIS